MMSGNLIQLYKYLTISCGQGPAAQMKPLRPEIGDSMGNINTPFAGSRIKKHLSSWNFYSQDNHVPFICLSLQSV